MSTHPYRSEHQHSTSTLASSTGETKKTFLGRWKLAFKREALEILPEHDSPLSSFLPTTPPLMSPLAIPPIQHDPLLLLTQQTWQGTSYDSAWQRQAQEGPQPPSNLPAIVLGLSGHQTHQPAPHSSSTYSGITSTFPTPPSFPDNPTHIEHGHPLPMLPSYTGTSPYRSLSNLPLCQALQESPCQSLSPDFLRRSDSTPHKEARDSMTGTEGGDRQSGSMQQRSERSMNSSPMSGSIVKEKPYTIPTIVPEQRHSLPKNTSMVFKEVVPPCPQSQPRKLPTPPQPTTPITISQALYLLATGKLAGIPDILSRVPIIDLFNHFLKELVADQDWARTPAGIDYSHYGYSYILKEEARHFACQAYNMIHLDHPVQVPAHYQCPQIDLPPMTFTPEPMTDEPPVPPPQAEMPVYTAPSYAYPRRYGPPGTQGPSRLFAAATNNELGTSNQPPGKPQPPSRPPPPSNPPVIPGRWAPPCYPSLLKPPDPPAPWVLDANNPGPWGALKPNMVQEPEDFSGDSNDIARFFSQCDMYFSVFNQYFCHHPHKVIFCTSCFSKDAQVWWELCTRELGRNALGDQIYPAYEQFVEEVRQQFWKDANTEIKFAQWERLQQSSFPDGDLFFQEFESLADEPRLPWQRQHPKLGESLGN